MFMASASPDSWGSYENRHGLKLCVLRNEALRAAVNALWHADERATRLSRCVQFGSVAGGLVVGGAREVAVRNHRSLRGTWASSAAGTPGQCAAVSVDETMNLCGECGASALGGEFCGICGAPQNSPNLTGWAAK